MYFSVNASPLCAAHPHRGGAYVCHLGCSGGCGMRPRPSPYSAPRQFICTQAHDPIRWPTRYSHPFYSFPIYYLDINIWFYRCARTDTLMPNCTLSIVSSAYIAVSFRIVFVNRRGDAGGCVQCNICLVHYEFNVI